MNYFKVCKLCNPLWPYRFIVLHMQHNKCEETWLTLLHNCPVAAKFLRLSRFSVFCSLTTTADHDIPTHTTNREFKRRSGNDITRRTSIATPLDYELVLF